MPRSKRNKTGITLVFLPFWHNCKLYAVSLTKTTSKGKNAKSKYVDSLRSAVDEYKNIYVIKFDNMRSSLFKDVRMHLRESKIFLGKNTVAQIALGRSPEDEYKDNLRQISQV